MISAATERELDRWAIGHPFALAPRMQAITLDVIMSGIFGIEDRPARGTPERRLRSTIKYLTAASTSVLPRSVSSSAPAARSPSACCVAPSRCSIARPIP